MNVLGSSEHAGGRSRMPHHDSPAMNHSTTDGSPFPWVFFIPMWFIKEIFFFSLMFVLGVIKKKKQKRGKKKSHVEA